MSTVATITYGISVYPEGRDDLSALGFLDALTRTLNEANMAIGAAMAQGGDGSLTTAEDLTMALDVALSVPVSNLATFLDNRWLLPIISDATILCDEATATERALLDTLAQAYPDFNWDTP